MYPLEPQDVKKVNTAYRRIVTKIPVPESLSILERLHKYEPRSMTGQPPIIWDRAEGFQVYDAYGNMWLDWSSGVLVTNAGHGRREVRDAIIQQAEHGLLHNYCFPSEVRSLLAEKLVSVAPPNIDKAFILTTGAEATENALKLARTYGHQQGGQQKNVMISFEGAFHGRTLGSQMLGGMPGLKGWIVHHDPDIVQVPFPDGYRNEGLQFRDFELELVKRSMNPDHVAGVILETYQGATACFAPVEYIQHLRQWCNQHNVLLIFDEVQAGFGRTGKFFAFEHYGVEADLICCGKGISGSLPLSAVLGNTKVMDMYPPGAMTSTHTGNPVCCAAALANIELLLNEHLTENAERVGSILHEGLLQLQQRHTDIIGIVQGKGLVYGLLIVKPGTKEPDKPLATKIVQHAFEQGLLFFSPVGGATVKIAPPLMITEDAVQEGLEVLANAIEQAQR